MIPELRPSIGVGCIIIRDHRVLLARRHRAHGTGSWSTPGGHLDFGESPAECAAREVMEEVGLVVTDAEFCAITNDVFDKSRHYITIWMIAKVSAGDAVIAAPEEITEIGWFSFEALPSPLFLSFEHLLNGAGMPDRSEWLRGRQSEQLG